MAEKHNGINMLHVDEGQILDSSAGVEPEGDGVPDESPMHKNDSSTKPVPLNITGVVASISKLDAMRNGYSEYAQSKEPTQIFEQMANHTFQDGYFYISEGGGSHLYVHNAHRIRNTPFRFRSPRGRIWYCHIWVIIEQSHIYARTHGRIRRIGLSRCALRSEPPRGQCVNLLGCCRYLTIHGPKSASTTWDCTLSHVVINYLNTQQDDTMQDPTEVIYHNIYGLYNKYGVIMNHPDALIIAQCYQTLHKSIGTEQEPSSMYYSQAGRMIERIHRMSASLVGVYMRDLLCILESKPLSTECLIESTCPDMIRFSVRTLNFWQLSFPALVLTETDFHCGQWASQSFTYSHSTLRDAITTVQFTQTAFLIRQ